MMKPHGARPVLIVVAAVLVALSAAVVAIAFAWPSNPPQPSYEWVNVGRLDDYAVNEPVAITKHRFWLVHLDGSGVPHEMPVGPTIIRSSSFEEVIALSRRSTHLGCAVSWRADFPFNGQVGFFRDPCSGSVWNVAGQRIFGPAPRNLDHYPVVVRDGEILVDVNNRICGNGYELEARELQCLPPAQYQGAPPAR
jgi:Rieske Fe-S protein